MAVDGSVDLGGEGVDFVCDPLGPVDGHSRHQRLSAFGRVRGLLPGLFEFDFAEHGLQRVEGDLLVDVHPPDGAARDVLVKRLAPRLRRRQQVVLGGDAPPRTIGLEGRQGAVGVEESPSPSVDGLDPPFPSSTFS